MIEVVMCIVVKEDKVLLVRRAKKEGDLQWQFPGGTVEKNEMIEETALRELKEEANVDGEIMEIIGERVHPYTKKEMAYVAIKYIDGELKTTDPDLDKVEWVAINKIGEYFTTPIYDKVEDYLNSIVK